jgi:hypothetical protein
MLEDEESNSISHPISCSHNCFVLFFKPKLFGDGEYHIGTIALIDFVLNRFQGNVWADMGLLTLFFLQRCNLLFLFAYFVGSHYKKRVIRAAVY